MEQLLKERSGIARQLPLQEMIRGSMLERHLECVRPDCKCHKSAKYRHGPYYFLSIRRKNKTFHVYVPKIMQEKVKTWVANYDKVWAGVEEITDINVKLIKAANKNRKGVKSNKD